MIFESRNFTLRTLSTVKKIHPETGGWFLEASSVMTNFRAKATNSIAEGTNSIAKWTNLIAKVTNSIANGTNSTDCKSDANSIAKTCIIVHAGSHKLPCTFTCIMAPIKHNAPLPFDIAAWYCVVICMLYGFEL